MELSDFYILQNLDLDLYESRKLARQKSTGKRCQLFFLKREQLDIEKVVQDHQTLQKISTDHLLPYLYFGKENEEEELVVAAIEHRDGELLERLLYREHHLEEAQALDFIFQICKGLSAAQKVGVLHGSLSPSSVFVSNNHCWVMGFQLPYGEEPLFYQAPEFFKNQEKNEATPLMVCHDIYSLGILWFHLLTGSPPYHGSSPKDLYRLKKKVLQPHQKIKEDTLQLLQRMIAPAPDQRFQTYSEFFSKLVLIKNRLLQSSEETLSDETTSENEAPVEELLIPPVERIDRYLSRLESSREMEAQVTRYTVRRRRVVLPISIFLGAVGLLVLATFVLPTILNQKQEDLFESIDIAEKVGSRPEDKEAIRRERFAKEAFQNAEDKYQVSENIDEGILLFANVARKFRDTRYGQDATARVQELRKMLFKKEEEEYQKAKKRSQESMSQSHFQEAIENLELFLAKFPETELKAEILNQIQSISETARARYHQKKFEAEKLVRAKKIQEAKRIYQYVVDHFGIKRFVDAAMVEMEALDQEEQKVAIHNKQEENAQKEEYYQLTVSAKIIKKALVTHNFKNVKRRLKRLKGKLKFPKSIQYFQDLELVINLYEDLILYILKLNNEFALNNKGIGYSLGDLLSKETQRRGFISPSSNSLHLILSFTSSPLNYRTPLYWSRLGLEEKADLAISIMDLHQGKKRVLKGSREWFRYRILGIGALYLIGGDYKKARGYFRKVQNPKVDKFIQQQGERLLLFSFPN